LRIEDESKKDETGTMDQKNVILFTVLSALILGVFWYVLPHYFPNYFPGPNSVVTQTNTGPSTPGATGTATSTGTTGQTTVAQPVVPAAPAVPEFKPRAAALADSPRIEIHSDRLLGTIALVGGRLDDLTLANYRETVDPTSPQIVLLNPPGTDDAYYADFGWIADAGTTLKLPDRDTRWTADGAALTPDHPVTLSWDNGQGLTFTRTFSLDKNFMFTVTDAVKNGGTAALKLYPYGRIRRVGTPPLAGYAILHEGLLGVLGGSLKETKYSAIAKAGSEPIDSTGGWLGITDKYWLVALAPDQTTPIHANFLHETEANKDAYLTVYNAANALDVAPGASASASTRLFAGAKEVHLLADYRDQLGIPLFERAVDFGYLYFLTKPIFYLLDFLYHAIGNFGLAILALTVCVRILMFPLANKSFRAMNKMKKLTPLMTELRERHKDDKQRLNQEMMELYKREKVNPAAGCLPVLVQIPIFFCLYKVLFVTIEMRHAPFFGWIKDLSAPDPTTWINLFGLLPWHVPHELSYLGPVAGIVSAVVSLGVWPILMGVTMFLQQKLNPPPPDPVQARIFMFLPIVFTFTLARFPAGLVIYWAWNNLLSISQQKFLMWRMSRKP
jgi:YidC/Oxa1 family membrane protein insertase